jgi:thiol:disulfide interchange protein/DsbC/DsbD-like thiol-disulfide interchange protein
MTRPLPCFGVVLLAIAVIATPAAGNSPSGPLVNVELVSEVASVQPGVPFWVAVKQQIAPGWHTYWVNPGDSGEPMRLEWALPRGVTADQISWPAPERIPLDPAMSYGYSGEVLLPVRIQPPAGTRLGNTLTLRASAAWLVCEKECIPEEATVALTLPVSTARPAADPRWGAEMARARAALPRPSPWPVTAAATEETVTLSVAATGLNPERIQDAWFYPLEWGLIGYAFHQTLAVSPRGLTLSVARGPLPDAVARPVEGVLVITEHLDAGPVRQAFTVRADPPAAGPPAAAWSWPALLQALALALLGGLVLNLMPCVLPVLSVKALSLVAHSGHGAAVMRRHGLTYTLGVLVSFAIVAGGLIAFRAAGEQIGWGFQLQSPTFVTLLAYVFFLMALAMSGVVTIGGRATGFGSTLAARSGYLGSFFTGALATLVATPCTAPFMATAVGYALTQPAPVALAVFEALGLGLALPYLLLSLVPAWARLLPRPGRWTVRLQQFLAFPLYATVAWLVWVLSLQSGPAGLAACLAGLVLLGLGAWLFETTRHATGGARGIRAVAVVCVIAAVGLVALSDEPTPAAVRANDADAGIPWELYSPELLTELRASGVPVFVNFTAAWCITCLVNERVALRSVEVAASFMEKGVAYLKADWTRRDPEIAQVLASFERSGVPLYLLYPASGAEQPHVLPQILTEHIVLEALERSRE